MVSGDTRRGLLRDTPLCLAEQERAGLLGFDSYLLA
jgi:hypothetical protein